MGNNYINKKFKFLKIATFLLFISLILIGIYFFLLGQNSLQKPRGIEVKTYYIGKLEDAEIYTKEQYLNNNTYIQIFEDVLPLLKKELDNDAKTANIKDKMQINLDISYSSLYNMLDNSEVNNKSAKYIYNGINYLMLSNKKNDYLNFDLLDIDKISKQPKNFLQCSISLLNDHSDEKNKTLKISFDNKYTSTHYEYIYKVEIDKENLNIHILKMN